MIASVCLLEALSYLLFMKFDEMKLLKVLIVIMLLNLETISISEVHRLRKRKI